MNTTALVKPHAANFDQPQSKVLAAGEGLRLRSGPGRDLIFKVTGDDTGGAQAEAEKSQRKAYTEGS